MKILSVVAAVLSSLVAITVLGTFFGVFEDLDKLIEEKEEISETETEVETEAETEVETEAPVAPGDDYKAIVADWNEGYRAEYGPSVDEGEGVYSSVLTPIVSDDHKYCVVKLEECFDNGSTVFTSNKEGVLVYPSFWDNTIVLSLDQLSNGYYNSNSFELYTGPEGAQRSDVLIVAPIDATVWYIN